MKWENIGKADNIHGLLSVNHKLGEDIARECAYDFSTYYT
jgi:hypothetical protein